MDREIWIALCAHRLQRRWRTIDPAELDEVAREIANNPDLLGLTPDEAALAWLEPGGTIRNVQPGTAGSSRSS
jgi:hypothetical protein